MLGVCFWEGRGGAGLKAGRCGGRLRIMLAHTTANATGGHLNAAAPPRQRQRAPRRQRPMAASIGEAAEVLGQATIAAVFVYTTLQWGYYRRMREAAEEARDEAEPARAKAAARRKAWEDRLAAAPRPGDRDRDRGRGDTA